MFLGSVYAFLSLVDKYMQGDILVLDAELVQPSLGCRYGEHHTKLPQSIFIGSRMHIDRAGSTTRNYTLLAEIKESWTQPVG